MWQALLNGLSILEAKWTVALGVVSLISLGFGVVFSLSRGTLQEKTNFLRIVLLVGSFFAFLVILRLAFLSEAFVPPYFDSVEHYRITKQLLTALETSTLLETFPKLTSTYYHLGFHIIAALLAFGLRANPIDVILVLGQIILASIPIPLFLLLRYETRSDVAAFFGMFLAGFGWYMPGFAVNWGKYPALAGLLALEVVLIFAYFIDRKKSDRHRLVLTGFLLTGITISTLFHTRTMVILVISIASWLIAGRISAFQKTSQYLFLGTLLAGLLLFGKFIAGEPVLNLTLEPYLKDGTWVTLMVIVLSPFALFRYPQGFYFSLLFVFGLFAALLIPVGIRSLLLENQTVLDRPFVEMMLYLPLSILGGLGLAGLIQVVRSIKALPEKANRYARIFITSLLVGLTGLVSIERYNFYPSDCCNFVGYDDTVAFDWLDKNLASGARILVAGTPLNVLPSGPSVNLAGTDGGIWIKALTGSKTMLAPFDTDFRAVGTLKRLCRRQVKYIYVGGLAQSFNAAQLNEKPEWYNRVLFLPHAQLYQITWCAK